MLPVPRMRSVRVRLIAMQTVLVIQKDGIHIAHHVKYALVPTIRTTRAVRGDTIHRLHVDVRDVW